MAKIPKNKDAEQTVLGSMLIDREVAPDIIGTIDDEDFYWEEHRILYRTMEDLFESDEPVDIVTVKNELERQSSLNKANGPDYLADLADKVVTTANIDEYTEIVKSKSILRQLIKAGMEITELGRNEELNISDVLDKAEEKVFDISTSGGGNEYSLIGDSLTDQIGKLEELHHSTGEVITGVPTGFSDLDFILTGLQGGQLLTLAGRPGTGKTSLALSFARQEAIDGFNVGIFSLEMQESELLNRLLCGEARVSLYKTSTGSLSKDEWGKLTGAANTYSKTTIAIDDSHTLPVINLKAKARRMKVKDDIDILFVDYLQLIEDSGYRNSREREVAHISRSLKGLAKELDIPIVALSQLNRAVEKREDKHPKLADLRESGAIEQDSDVVLFLYRGGYYEDYDNEVDMSEVIVAKQRNGPLGKVELAFHKKFASFYEISPEKKREVS